MADHYQTLHWKIDPSGAVAGAAEIKRVLHEVEVVADRVQAKLNGIASGMSGPMSSAGTTVNNFTQTLNQLNQQAVITTTSIQNIGITANTTNNHLRASVDHSNDLDAAFGKVAKWAGALAPVVKVVMDLGNALKEAREHAEEVAKTALGQRDKGREVAALMNEPEVNDRVMSRIHRVSMGTGMGFDKADLFLRSFEGSVSAGVDKGHLNEKDKADVAVEVGRWAMRNNIDDATAGKAAGVIAQHVDLNNQKDANGTLMTPSQAMAAKLESASLMASNKGLGNVSKLMKENSGIKQAGLNSGRLHSLAEADAITAVLSSSIKDEGRIATAYIQAASLVNDQGKGKDFLETHGIADQDGDVAKFHKMAKVLKEAEKAHKGPRKFDPFAYLAENGFDNEAEVRAVVALAEGDELLTKNTKLASDTGQDGKAAVEANRRSMESKEAQLGVGKAETEYAEYVQGKKGEDLYILRMKAAARLEHKGLLNHKDQKVHDLVRSNFGLDQMLGLPPEVLNRIDDEVRTDLDPKARNAGVEPTRYPDWGTDRSGKTDIQATLDDMRKKGKNPLVGQGDNAMMIEVKNGDVPADVRAVRKAAQQPQPGPAANPAVNPAGGGAPAAPIKKADAGEVLAPILGQMLAELREQTKALQDDGGFADPPFPNSVGPRRA